MSKKDIKLAVWLEDEEVRDKAVALSNYLKVQLIQKEEEKNKVSLVLDYSVQGLSLKGNGLTIKGDFSNMLRRLKLNNLNGEFLIKAAKRKRFSGNPLVIDATAGLGEDALLLAAAGFEVWMYEYDPIIAALLRDTLERAQYVPELREIVARMKLFEGNSIEAMPKLVQRPDLILLDPMFPQRQKSALIKKKFQLLQLLEQPCANEEALLTAAIAANPHKIIIKRPLKGPFLSNVKPSYSISGKAIRYDCIVMTEK